MATTPEGRVKAKVRKYLSEIGAWFFMPVSNGMGAHGIPDVVACYRGRFIGIECKAPGKRGNTSELQKRQLKAISDADGFSLVVDDVSQLVSFISESFGEPHADQT